jgi:hypothetical protein
MPALEAAFPTLLLPVEVVLEYRDCCGSALSMLFAGDSPGNPHRTPPLLLALLIPGDEWFLGEYPAFLGTFR